MTDWQNFFKAEDFTDHMGPISAKNIADLCSQKLWIAIQLAEKVSGDLKMGGYHGVPAKWLTDFSEGATHEARIIDVKKL